MSSALRLFMILVLVLAAAALGLIASNAYRPKPETPTALVAPAPASVPQYLVAAHPLQAGNWLRDDDVTLHPVASGPPPQGAIRDTPEARTELRGSIVRRYVAEGAPVTQDDVLRPRDRGFLASVLTPDTRAVSINVDAESGVSGLVWPGDLVDVVLTQANDRATQAHRALSETVLRNIRVVAIDQDIVEGVPVNGATAGKASHSVSLQLTPEQVNVIAVARALGRLSLAVRSAVDKGDTADAGVTFDCDVSQEWARKATVLIYSGGDAKSFSVRKDGGDAPARGCDASRDVARNDAALTRSGHDKAGEDTTRLEEKR